MKRFSKREDLYPLETPEDVSFIKKDPNAPTPAHHITAEEVMSSPMDNSNQYDSKSALESLKARMRLSFGDLDDNSTATASKTFNPPKMKIEAEPKVKAEPKPVINVQPEPTKPTQSAPIFKVPNEPAVNAQPIVTKNTQPDFARTVRPETVRTATTTFGTATKDMAQKSLLEKCKPYVTDEKGRDVSNAVPLYKLESVADILEGKSKDTLSRLAKQYDISVEDLSKVKKEEPKEVAAQPVIKTEPQAQPKAQPAVQTRQSAQTQPLTQTSTQTQPLPQSKPLTQAQPSTQTQPFTQTKPLSIPKKGKVKTSPIKTEVAPQPAKKPDIPTKDKEIIEINAFFENVQSSVPFSVSEVNTAVTAASAAAAAAAGAKDTAENMTVTFTPVSVPQSDKPKIMVSSNTQNIDLTGEMAAIRDVNSYSQGETVTLEKDEFEEFIPEEEIKNDKDVKTYLRKFSIAKRRSFLTTTFSLILTLVLAFMKLPFMTGLLLGETKVAMAVCTVLTLIIVIINGSMFASLAKMFSKNVSADIAPTLASIAVLIYALMGILSGEIVLDMLILLGFTLTIRALGKFRRASYMLSNLKQIAVSAPKNAVRLIDDSAVTFAMAKNSIEGDTLIAAPQKCNHLGDFLKYSTFGTLLNGKMPLITILSLVIALICGLAATSYYAGTFFGFYTVASVLCFASIPPLFFINDFPLYSAAKKLNKKGGMIAGQMGASHIEMANAVLLKSSDIFPAGTVTLHQMKILSDNSLDETILRAASLTQSLNSPLAPIFKKIAGESNISTLPNSDTIKYEEKMGISGWVDNKPLFIGNRTLLEAHGITVPDVEVDRKILRSGYFPIYLASEGRACALFMVQYSVNPAVANELRHLTKLGVTILVSNTDPNITDQMICDYLGLYSDSVMIMSNAGYQMFKNTNAPQESCSAPACFRGKNIMIAKIMNCANEIKRSNTLLCVLYILSLILGVVIFAYSSFAGSGILINSGAVLLYSIICTVITYILYLFLKP
jgi:Cu+-exporting ATPase